MVQSNPDDFARPEQSFSRSASPNHLSTEQKTAFVISYSNVWVVRSIIRFDGARLSYALVRSNCNKLVITWPLGRLTDLSPSGASRPRVINQPAPSWPCYNYYLSPTPCCNEGEDITNKTSWTIIAYKWLH